MSIRRDDLLERLPNPTVPVPAATDRAEAVILSALAGLTSHESAVWTVALTGLLLDVVLTAYGLSLGLTERNPVARELMSSLTPLGAMLLLKTLALLVAGIGWLLVPRSARAAVPACLAVPWWIAVLFNATLITSVL